MEAVKQYEIWWAALPAPAGRRPVLLLTRDSAYSYLQKVVVAEITTTIRNIAVEVPLGTPDGVPQKSVANFDNLRTVSRASLTKRIGHLGSRRYPEVKRALGYALAWDELIGVA